MIAHRGGHGLPDDYEPCGDCGFDHAYEPTEAWRAHNEAAQKRLKDKCEHTPDMTTAQFAEDATTREVIVDVWCSKCGESGSCKLTPDDLIFD